MIASLFWRYYMTLNQFLNNKNTLSLTFINNYINLQNQTDFYIKQLYSHLFTKGSKTITIPFDFYYFEKLDKHTYLLKHYKSKTLSKSKSTYNTIQITNTDIDLTNSTTFTYTHISKDEKIFKKHNSKKLISSSLKKSEDLTSSNFSDLAAVSSNRQLSAVVH